MKIPLFTTWRRGDPEQMQTRTERMRLALLYLLVVLLCGLAAFVPRRGEALIDPLQRFLFDRQMQWLREWSPRPAAVEPVLIGIDEDSFTQFPEPFTLWHRHFAQALEALTHAEPAAVGMDIVLPERSYENILPGIQLALIRSLVMLRQRTVAVFVFTIDANGKQILPHPTYRTMLGQENFGSDQAQRDPDGVARRFAESRSEGGVTVPSFAGQLMRGMKRPVEEGYIDYSRGAAAAYIPIQQVIAWLEQGRDDELKRHFDGKVVLIGSLVNDRDQWKMPVALSNWAPDEPMQAGVVIHLQTLRSLLGAGLIAAPPVWLEWLALLLFAGAVCWRFDLRRFLFGFVVLPALLTAASMLALREHFMPPLAIGLAALITALVVRMVADGWQTAAEKNRWKRSFSGSVSPALLQEMMADGARYGVQSHSMNICVLFSDIRGFTALSESLSAETVTSVLTRYFDRMVAVAHRYGGTIDKFTGDGVMVLFGAPRALPNSCMNSVKCAREMIATLVDLNREFSRDGLPVFAIGIGINCGNAVVGNIGSSERHNYSAIGDVVNVASRVQGLTKQLGREIVMTESVRHELGNFADQLELTDCGMQEIRGHSPIQVWGIKSRADQPEHLGEST